MLLKIRKKWRSALVLPKVMWSLLIVVVYMIGRLLPVPTVPINQELLQGIGDSTLLNNLATVTGARLSNMTLFSLGLSPWMTTVIIWRFFTVFDLLKNLTSVEVHRYRMLLSLLVATIQAFGLSASVRFMDVSVLGLEGHTVNLIVTMTILVTGAIVLTWLGNINSEKGLGGMTIIIIVNMVLAFIENETQYISTHDFSSSKVWLEVATFIVVYFLLVMVTVLLYRGEYRIPIKRVGIQTAYNANSYLPIRVTPAGAMPFMYGMTLMMLPPYIISALLYFFPENNILLALSTQIGISRLPGVILYILLLYVLAIGFSYYNYDAYDIAKNMRNNGDYIEGIQPGNPTKRYIQTKVNYLAQFGAGTVILIGGIPLLVVVQQGGRTGNVSIALLINNAYIVSSLLLGVIEQVGMLQNWKKYKNLI